MLNRTLEILINFIDVIPMMVSGFILLFCMLFISDLVGKVAKFFLPKKMDKSLRSFIPKAVKFFTFIFGGILALNLTGMSSTGIATMFGFSTIAIGVSLKDIFMNTIQGIMILINHPFKLGDTVIIEGNTGVVIKIDLMYTTLEINDEIKLVPNSKMFTEIVTIRRVVTKDSE